MITYREIILIILEVLFIINIILEVISQKSNKKVIEQINILIKTLNIHNELTKELKRVIKYR